MSKKITKADLEKEIERLKNVVANRDAQITQIENDYSNSNRRFDNLIEQLSLALKDRFESYEFNQFGTVNRERLQALTVNGIFFKIGRLVVIAEEYKELKDRVLPIEKSKVLEHEIQNHKA